MQQNESRDYLWRRQKCGRYSFSHLLFSKFYIIYIYIYFPHRKYSNVYLLKSQQSKEHKNIIALASLTFHPSDIFLLISFPTEAPRVNQIKHQIWPDPPERMTYTSPLISNQLFLSHQSGNSNNHSSIFMFDIGYLARAILDFSYL